MLPITPHRAHTTPHHKHRTRKTVIAGAIVAALTAGFLVTTPATAATTTTTTTSTVIGYGSTWAAYRSNTAPAKTWKTDFSILTGWKNSAGAFGWGKDTGTIATKLPTPTGTQPVSTYFRKTLTLTSVPTRTQITTWADDGVIVFVNGVEIGRSNVQGTSPATHTTYAATAPQSLNARKAPVKFTIPRNLLVVGKNKVAVQVVANWRKTPNLTFDAKIVRSDTVTTVVTPKPTATPTVKPTATATPKPTATATPKPTATATPKPTATATPKPTVSPTATPKPTPTPTTAPPTDGATLAGWGAPVFRDEFSYVDQTTGKPAVDPTKWNVRDRSNLGLLFDAAEVRKEQTTVDAAGVLHIKADWLDTPVIRPSTQSGPTELWHKTGYLDQRSLKSGDVSYAQTYGRWEFRVKTPSGPNTFGSLAALWLRNSQSGEIDIMEAWGYADAAVRDQRIDTATTTIHTHTSDASANSRYILHHEDFGGPDKVWSTWHTYAFEYTPDYAAVIVDGKEIIRMTPATHPNLWDSRYFGTPMHVRMNLHVGPSATYWGLPDPNAKEDTQNLDFQVDYVRIWKYTP